MDAIGITMQATLYLFLAGTFPGVKREVILTSVSSSSSPSFQEPLKFIFIQSLVSVENANCGS